MRCPCLPTKSASACLSNGMPQLPTTHRDATLHGLFEAQGQRAPDATAIVFESTKLTYRELNERSNRLAHGLCALGVGSDVLVGICLHRSLDLIVALLAVLKAGGAYVPLDPTYPQERLRMMLEDARAPVLLTDATLRDTVSASGAGTRLLDVADVTWSTQASTNPRHIVRGEHLAYTIFTSGSTGRPKGAQNTHRGINGNRLMWMQEAFRLDASDAILQKTPMSFDVSVWEFFWPLIQGARALRRLRPGRTSGSLVSCEKTNQNPSASRPRTSFRRRCSECSSKSVGCTNVAH